VDSKIRRDADALGLLAEPHVGTGHQTEIAALPPSSHVRWRRGSFDKHKSYDWPDTGASLILLLLLSLVLWAAIGGLSRL
jgi:hypothetical protein